jgi:hypothetical protein
VFIVETECDVEVWRLNVWTEDFMRAVVQRYWKWFSEALIVPVLEIRCQETDSED